MRAPSILVPLGWALLMPIACLSGIFSSKMSVEDDEESISLDSVLNRQLQAALEVALAIPSLDKADALFAVGVSVAKANSPEMKQRLRHLVTAFNQANGFPSLATDDTSKIDRALLLKDLMVNHPYKSKRVGNNAGIKLTEAMKLVGFDDRMARSGSNVYQRAFRLIESNRKKEAAAAHVTAEQASAHRQQRQQQQQQQRPSSISVDSESDDDEDSDDLSPLSTELGSSFGRRNDASSQQTGSSISSSTTVLSDFIPDDFHDNYFVWPLTYPIDTEDESINSSGNKTVLQKLPARKSMPQSLQSLTTTQCTRLTSEGAHHRRQLIEEGRTIRSSMHKTATVLWKSVVDGYNTLKIFSTAEKVANAVNLISGMDVLSGHEVDSAVQRGDAGKSPPRRGRHSDLPDIEFKLYCDAVFTYSAIQQINCAERSNRSQLKSLVGEILNAKRADDGKDPIGEANFYTRIELHNSRKQDQTDPDRRESIRVKWLTYSAQTLNFQRWEECAVQLGFARHPREDEETNGHHIIWHEEQPQRVLQLDEISISLDASSTKGGGRPSKVLGAKGVQGSGQEAPKSSDKVTAIFGMNFADEATPPYLQFPTAATKEERYKLNVGVLVGLRQVYARFGYSTKRFFDTGIGMNKKGGMNTHAFSKYMIEFLSKLYPDADDVPGKRVLIKLDSGPGRFNPEMQSHMRLLGFYVFAGVPNGTEVGQEMDQLYSNAKTKIYKNRDDLWRARLRINRNDSSPLSFADIGFIIFGGDVALPDGSTIALVPAFDMVFDEAHLQAAREKCGYLPSTRACLNDPKVRRQVVMRSRSRGSDDDSESGSDEEDEIDVAADSIGALYEDFERRNHEVCDQLIEKGHTLMSKLKLKVSRVQANQINGRDRVATEPNTRARQDLLMKVGTAGHFFQVTNGGGPMNSNDALIAWARKEMVAKAALMRKQKTGQAKFADTHVTGVDILNRKPERKWKIWTVADLKYMITWKQGLVPTAPFDDKVSGLNKPQLQALYETKYLDLGIPTDEAVAWTTAMEDEMLRLESGVIADFVNDTGLFNAMERDNEWLSIRLSAIDVTRKKHVLTRVFQGLSSLERDRLLDELSMVQYEATMPRLGEEEDIFGDEDDDSIEFTGEAFGV